MFDKNPVENDNGRMTLTGGVANCIRARYDDTTVRVYQAYPPAIADPALRAQRFVPPFLLTRMTWIKTSFFWMMYRSGWAGKPGQERILAIDIMRSGFDWCLARAQHSQYRPESGLSREQWRNRFRQSPVRVQWDPERDRHLHRLPVRAIQLGLRGEAIHRYAAEWTVSISDITVLAQQVRDDASGTLAAEITARETVYPVSVDAQEVLQS